MNRQIFRYGTAEINHLKKRDRILGPAIDRIGPIEREVTPDPFTALVSGIVAQQISTKAAETVWSRMKERFGYISPAALASASPEEIQGSAACRCGKPGISMVSVLPWCRETWTFRRFPIFPTR